MPIPDGLLVVRPYVTFIEVSNLFFPSAGIDQAGNCDDACLRQIVGWVVNFEISNQPGFTIGITTAKTMVGQLGPPTFAGRRFSRGSTLPSRPLLLARSPANCKWPTS